VVVPSRWYENQPMVVLEALARGVPVVGSALGGMPELIEPGATGELVPANDPSALADALAPFVRDPGYAFAMRDRARATIVDAFSPERHLERIGGTYALAARTMLQRAA
jgi:glycosyltransferase involved in cell wall biosynthesis